MKTISVNGISLAYERRGTGSPLLLVHGFPLDHRFWQPLVAHLEGIFDVILPDLRGFGQSEAPSGTYQISDMASDLAALLDGLNIPTAFIVGHSMGGYVCLAFTQAYAWRVNGLGLVGTQAAPDTPERKAGRYATAEQVVRSGVSEVAGLAEKLSANADNVPFFREIILSQSPQGVAGALIAMAERPDSRPLLSSFQFPVVLMHGLADALISAERSSEMKSLMPGAELIELPGVGHSPPIEAPFETARGLLILFPPKLE